MFAAKSLSVSEGTRRKCESDALKNSPTDSKTNPWRPCTTFIYRCKWTNL